jgi:hypothetical protein
MIVKDGTVQEDGLGRLKQFDERSRSFAAVEVIDRKPRSYTNNFRAYDPRLDQGREGACVGHAFANDLAVWPVMVPDVVNATAQAIYFAAQKRDPWSGGAYPGASPQYEGTSVLAGAQVVQKELGLIESYYWCFGLDQVIQTLGYWPIVFGLDWHAGMMRTDSNGFIHPTGTVVGGHAILGRGINLKRKEVLLRNSWGPSWGINGDCKISFDDLGKLLAAQGEACVPVGRRMVSSLA